MIVSPLNRDAAILVNLRQTLQQIRPSSKPIEKIVVPAGTTSVQVYSDEGRTSLVYTDTTPVLSVVNGRTLYTPDDTHLNGTMCQPVYWLTAQPSGSTITYRNLDNLLVQSVVVATKADPKYLSSGNAAVLVVKPSKTVDSKASDDRSMVLMDFDLQVRLTVPDWTNLSEENRVVTFMGVGNCIRLALMTDRYRCGNATLYDSDIDGTYVSELTPLESKDVLKGKMRIRCAYWASPSGY